MSITTRYPNTSLLPGGTYDSRHHAPIGSVAQAPGVNPISADSRKNPYEIQRVVLAGVSDEMQQDGNLDAPLVRIRHGNTGFMFLDTSIATRNNTNQSQTSWILGVSQDGGSLHVRRIRRFAVVYIDMSWGVPNMNTYNNMFTFLSTVSGLTHTVTVPVGMYSSPTVAIAALVAACNTVVGASGITFSSTSTLVGSNLYYTLNGNFIWQLRPDLMPNFNQVQTFWSMPDTFAGTSMPIGPLLMQYTRYIDITSNGLMKYTKQVNSSNNQKGSLLNRIYVNDPLATIIRYEITQPAWHNFDPSDTVASLDLAAFDEFGNSVYLFQPTANNFNIELALLTEI